MNAAEGKRDLLKNTYVKNILSALAVAAIGFVLLNLTFLLYFLVFQFFGIFVPSNPLLSTPQWIPLSQHIIFLIIIGLISWIIFRSKLPVIIKATFLTVPTAVSLVILGIMFYPSPVLPYLFGALFAAAVLCYFYRAHKPWLYFYSVILVAAALVIFNLTGGEM